MNDETKLMVVWGWLTVVWHAIYPEAAAGAITGGLFFWSLAPNIPKRDRFWLAIASISLGYGIGLPAARSQEWAGWEWIFAGLGASLIHVVIVSVQAMVTTSSPMPPWLEGFLRLVLRIKNRGSEE